MVASHEDVMWIETTTTTEQEKTEMKKSSKRTKRKKEAATTTTTNKKARATIYGAALIQFFHWLRNRKYTVTEAQHIVENEGFNVAFKRKNAKTILLHTMRAHLHCKCPAAAADLDK